LSTSQPPKAPKKNSAAPTASAKGNAKNAVNAEAKTKQKIITLEGATAQEVAVFCGQFDEHIQQIENRLSVRILHRGDRFSIEGPSTKNNGEITLSATQILRSLFDDLRAGEEITPDHVHLTIQQFYQGGNDANHSPSPQTAYSQDINSDDLTIIRTKKMSVKPRGLNQQSYVRAVLTNDINFGVGPAGTGKTYLAVACAVQALLNDEVERILLVRPAVEAGEKLGFLPGDLSQKVDPYLRPLFDALYEMMGFEIVDKLIERNIIEIAPLAYMRGRTLSNAFIILDESQNTTREQMKMFLTRIGFGSTAVINGDPSQIDLPRGQNSGLRHACGVLEGVNGISFTYFTSKDVVRHPLVQRIVDAYDRSENGPSDTSTAHHSPRTQNSVQNGAQNNNQGNTQPNNHHNTPSDSTPQ
jgi:phosphate starvation-inducible PhoH-like protein